MIERNFTRIESNQMEIGMRFSAPVFFEDGENMFLAEGKTAKQYHINALKRWNIPYLLTYGRILLESELIFDENGDVFIEELEEVEELESLES
ncbi:MAG: phosphohydrolase [Treponema sp.]|nr:phosphohydrolase [Treponema sp.]MBQ7881299.1 phosphohydrolase [Treponema sp.]